MKAYIYSIRSLVDDEVLYVGSTNDFNKRKNQHYSALDRQAHPSKTLQKVYNSLNGNVYMKSEFVFDDKVYPKRIVEYFYTSFLMPHCNRTFNMSNGKKFDNMKLIDSELAKEIIEKIV